MPNIPGVADHAASTEPVVNAAKLGGLLSAFLVAVGGVIAIFTGGFGLDDLGPLGIGVAAVVTTGLAVAVYFIQVWQGLRARAKVTPLVRPRNNDGVTLVPSTRVSHVMNIHVSGGPATATRAEVLGGLRRAEDQR